MKTIHTKTRSLSKFRREKLIGKLYRDFLCKDPLFHFFYEPELIIRVNDEETIKKIESYLDSVGIGFRVYDFPKPIGKEGNYCFECNPIVLKNLDVFLGLYHIHAVFALTLSKNKFKEYISRVSHTAYNMGNYDYMEEGLDRMGSGIFYQNLFYNLYFKLDNKNK